MAMKVKEAAEAAASKVISFSMTVWRSRFLLVFLVFLAFNMNLKKDGWLQIHVRIWTAFLINFFVMWDCSYLVVTGCYMSVVNLRAYQVAAKLANRSKMKALIYTTHQAPGVNTCELAWWSAVSELELGLMKFCWKIWNILDQECFCFMNIKW